MTLATESSSGSSSTAMVTPEKRPSRVATTTGTRRTIGRNRRRRPVAPPSDAVTTATAADEIHGKENYGSHRSRRRANATSTTTSTPMKNRRKSHLKYTHGEDIEGFGSFSVENPACSFSPAPSHSDPPITRHSPDEATICERAVQDFRRSLRKVSVPSNPWSDVPGLMDKIVRASLSLSGTVDSLGLEGHASVLMSFCRKLIKEVGGGSNRETNPEFFPEDYLFVAVHILRSVAFVLTDWATAERKEALLKLFFHLIMSTTKATRGRNPAKTVNTERNQWIALAGYEGLAKVISNYSLPQTLGDGKHRMVSFRLMRWKLDGDFHRRILFAIPSTDGRKETNSKDDIPETGNMSVRQVSTIAFQTTMVVLKAMLAREDKLPMPFGNRGQILPGESENGSENRMGQCRRFSLELLHRIHKPWLMLLASASIQEREAAKEILSYSKGIHRLLWDAASTLKSSSHSATGNVDEDCLELRQQAILHLLTCTGISKLDRLIRKTFFENGCTYAWKAASVFAQHLPPKTSTRNSVISDFYESLDAVFSRMVSMDPTIPLEFVEYRAHRSLHLESSLSTPTIHPSISSLTNLNDMVIGEEENSTGCYRIIFHILDIASYCKARIQSSISDSQPKHESQILYDEKGRITSKSISILERLILVFNRQVTHRLGDLPNEITNRIMKLFCNLSLHKTLFLVMKRFESDEPSLGTITQLESELVAVAIILTKCLGPMVSMSLSCSPQKTSQLVELMMECFLRPLALYEQLFETHLNTEDDGGVYDSQRHLESSNIICQSLTKIITDTSQRSNDIDLPISCLEKAAKSLYAISRQRNERSLPEYSISPLLCSLKLYHQLDSLNREKKDYQLSSRLFLLSSILQSIDKIDEAFLASCALVKYESQKQRDTTLGNTTRQDNFFSYFVSKSCGLLPPTFTETPRLPQIIRSVCRQRASDLSRIETDGRREALPSQNHLCIDWTIESLLDSISGNDNTVRVPHPLHSIQRLLDFDGIVDQETKLMHVFAVTELLVQSARSIKQLSHGLGSDERKLENSLYNYTHLRISLEHAVNDLDLKYPRIFNSLLGLVASASLIPAFSLAGNTFSSDRDNEVNPRLVETAIEIANESIRSLEQTDDNEDELCWVLLSQSLRITIKIQIVILLRKTKDTDFDDEFLKGCVDVAERILAAENSSRESRVYLRAKYSAIWTFTYLQNELLTQGDQDRAAIFSFWTLALAKRIEPHQPWFHALAMTLCAKDSNMIRLKKALVPTSPKNVIVHGSILWMFEKELQLCQLRIAVVQSIASDKEFLHTQMRKVEDIRDELELHTVKKNDKLFVLYTWVLSTLYLVETVIALASGSFSMALKTSQTCQKCCQMILREHTFDVGDFDDWIYAIATSNVLAMASHRYTEILSRRPLLHYLLGDHRKALAYVHSILDYLDVNPDSLYCQEGRGYTQQGLSELLEASTLVRLFLQMNSWASAPEITMGRFADVEPQYLSRQYCKHGELSSSSAIHSIQDMIAIGDVLYGDSISNQFQQKWCSFYVEAATLMTNRAHSLHFKSLRVPLYIEKNLGMPVTNQLMLRDVRRMLESSQVLDRESEVTIRQLCTQIHESEFSCSEDKAWSLYYIGLMELESARYSGALQNLWIEGNYDETTCPDVYDNENIRSARYNLTKALLYSPQGSGIFVRKILRSLALAVGPRTSSGIGMSAGILILRSIGQSIRRKLSWSFEKNFDSPESESLKNLKEIFCVFERIHQADPDGDHKIESFLDELAARTPKNWEFVAPVICPSGEMLVSIIQKPDANHNKFSISTKCIFPPEGDNAYDIIMKPLDSILFRVHEQLKGADPSLASSSGNKEDIKRKWWDQRNRLDLEMRDLLENVESLYFSKFFDIRSNEVSASISSSRNDLKEFPCGNLTSRFEATLDNNNSGCPSSEKHLEKTAVLRKLTIPKLKDRLLSAGASTSQFRKLRKADLIELLIEMEHDGKENEKCGSLEVNSNGSKTYDESCLFLILDENLQRFPFEGLSTLKEKTVCRVPCLSFVLATLLENNGNSDPFPLVDPAAVSYVLNPENNLQATQDRVLPAIRDITSSSNWDWKGTIGDIPPVSFFSEAVCENEGLMMYFGHGGAQVCFSRRKVEELIDYRACDRPRGEQTEARNTPCRASVLLMGCSSGRLVSINRKNSNSIEETPLYYEPEGVALSYLCAGAPCVIGNLWDVTDNDIDRFSISLLEDFFSETRYRDSYKGTTSLAKSLSYSRSVCKLKHLVGCAPVCYGVPVFLKRKNN